MNRKVSYKMNAAILRELRVQNLSTASVFSDAMRAAKKLKEALLKTQEPCYRSSKRKTQIGGKR